MEQRISRNLSSAILMPAWRQTWRLIEETIIVVFEWSRILPTKASLFITQARCLVACLARLLSFGPLSWFSYSSTFSSKHVKILHAHKWGKWMAFVSFTVWTSPLPFLKSALMSYTRAVAEISLELFHPICNSTEWSICTAIFICRASADIIVTYARRFSFCRRNNKSSKNAICCRQNNMSFGLSTLKCDQKELLCQISIIILKYR